MIKYKIGLLFSKKDYLYNVDNYGKTYNLLFITGLVGAGKSTISKELSKEKEITILSQDWLTWSEVYSDDKIAMDILNKFYKTCPKAQEAAINNLWHKNLLSKIEKMMEYINSIFYYDKVEFTKTVGNEIGFNNGKNETIKCLIKNNMSEKDIIKFGQISKEELDKIKKSMGK